MRNQTQPRQRASCLPTSEEDKRQTRPHWHYNHISDDILPALRAAGVTEAHIEQMLVHNPRAIFEARHGGQA